MSTHTEITWAMAAEEAAVVVHIEKKSIFDYKFHAILQTHFSLFDALHSTMADLHRRA